MNENERLKWEKSISKEKNKLYKFDRTQERAEQSIAERNLEFAFYLYGQAVSIAQDMHDTKRECDTLIDLGKAAYGLGNIDALRFLQQALEIADAADDSETIGRIWRIIAQFSKRAGDLPHAVESFHRAEEAGSIQRTVIIAREEPTTSRTVARIQDISIRSSNPSTTLGVGSQIKQIKRNKMANLLINYTVSIVLLIAIIGASLTIASLLPNNLGVTLIVILVIFVIILNRFLISYINEDKGK